MEQIKKIIIIGGGTSGWMTAASLIRNCTGIEIVVVDSESIPTIGVGESTIIYINSFLENLGLHDDDWMSYCNATYKMSINYTNWGGQKETVRYPFGVATYLDKYGPCEWFQKASIIGGDRDEFADFAVGTGQMMHQNKLTGEDPGIRDWYFRDDTSYHLEAHLFSKYLREEYSIPNGVNHIKDTIIKVHQNDEDGYISGLETNNNGILTADLYVDCTGYKSLLISETLNEPYISFNDKLINDKAVATHLPYLDKEVELVHNTDAYALSSGWVWNTPLWNSIGTGYVYSSQFITPEEAEEEFKEYLINDRKVPHSREEVEAAPMHKVGIKNGMYERSWAKNVCAIGLAYGFIEPLASTGLMFVAKQAHNLIKALQSRKGQINGYDKSLYNKKCKDNIIPFAGFVAAHYALAENSSSPYWKYVTGDINYMEDPHNIWIELTKKIPAASDEFDTWWGQIRPDDPVLYVMAGMGYDPIEKSISIGQLGKEGIQRLVDLQNDITEDIEKQKEYIKDFPSHHQFLKNTIYQGME